ncbi:MAG: 50S ribosomal protein L21, partial [Parcubacteria group bacterium]|nr:50S ribosomal protein L21 [Parcubacteria group bacterium]
LAVIETGGKQYLISPQQRIKIEKIKNIKEGEEITFDKVLLLVDDEGKIQIGKPYLERVKVVAQVEKTGRDKKIIVFRYHSKTRYHKKKGHRQHYMKAKIKEIK